MRLQGMAKERRWRLEEKREEEVEVEVEVDVIAADEASVIASRPPASSHLQGADVDELGEHKVVFEMEDELDVVVEGVPSSLDCAGQTFPFLVLDDLPTGNRDSAAFCGVVDEKALFEWPVQPFESGL